MSHFINYRSTKKCINLVEVRARFLPSFKHKNPCHFLIIMINEVLRKHLGWSVNQKVKLFVPTPCRWWFVINPDEKGYSSYYRNYKSEYKITWPKELPSPRMQYYQWKDVEFTILKNTAYNSLVINFLTDARWSRGSSAVS